MAIDCAGKDLTSSNLLAPTYCEIIDEIALLICPKTQINIDINAPTIPTAAKLSVAFSSILPIIAVSVIDNNGSAIPAINAGIANLFILLKLISALKNFIFYKGNHICFKDYTETPFRAKIKSCYRKPAAYKNHKKNYVTLCYQNLTL